MVHFVLVSIQRFRWSVVSWLFVVSRLVGAERGFRGLGLGGGQAGIHGLAGDGGGSGALFFCVVRVLGVVWARIF